MTYNIDDSGVLPNIIQLGEISELSAVKNFNLGIQVPNGVSHSLVFDIGISALPEEFGDDIDITDNYISATLVTKTVRNLSLSITSQQLSSGIGNSTTVTLEVQNFGNVDENELQILASLSSEDYFLPFTAYMSVGNTGLAYQLNKYHPLILDKNSSRQVQLDIMIPDDISIVKTYRVSDFSVISNTNEFQPLTHRNNIVVDYIREIHLGLNGNETPVRDDIGYLWVNIKTDSTLDENYLVTFSLPSGWGLICDSKVIDSNGISIDSELIGSIFARIQYCELINDGDVWTSAQLSDCI